MKRLFTLLAIMTLLSQCNIPSKDQNKSSNIPDLELKQAQNLMSTNCFACHGPAEPGKRIAPPMAEVKSHYLTSDMSRDEFVSKVVSFVGQPSEEKSKMPGALRKFNLMPAMGFSEEVITKIAVAIYETPDDSPIWNRFPSAANDQKVSPMDQGRNMALSTKTQLGKNLMGAIKAKGTLGALEFCNVKAMPLTDSMRRVHNATITRVTDKPRNPNNKANELELQHIETFKKMITSDEQMKPIFNETETQYDFYMPIMTNNMCLQCHGAPEEQILPAIIARLDSLYPGDKARGYGENEVRGIWSIHWEKETVRNE